MTNKYTSTTIRIYDESTGELLQKQCTQCGLIKDISEFNKDKSHLDGHRSDCKKCRSNDKKMKERKKKYRQSSRGKAAKARRKHKRRALEKGNGGSYTKEQWNKCLDYFNHCDSYTGQPMNIISVDHVIPISKGGMNYIHNIIPCEKRVNASKNNSDLWEWYSKQPYFSWDRYLKICMWIIKMGGATK